MIADRTIKRLMVAIVIALMLNFFATVGTYVQQGNKDETIDATAQNAQDVKDYVDDLREPTPAEQERNEAVTRAVQEVPRIKQILCDVFPEADGCQ